MGNVLVLYYSKDGSTKRMAEYVAEGARQVSTIDVRFRSTQEATRDDVLWCDGMAVGSPTYLGTVAAEMKRFWENLLPVWQKIDGKIGCAFSSQGGWGGGAELTCMAMMTVMLNYGMLVFGVTDYSGHQFTLHYGATQAGEPREEKEVEACRRLGRRLAEWVAVYIDGREDLHPNQAEYKRVP
jgi:NAD(P)H dehydrogenase (quinone)